MRSFFLFVLFSSAVFLPVTAIAEIYSYTDKNDHKWFSDSAKPAFMTTRYKSLNNKIGSPLSTISCAPKGSKALKMRQARIDPIITVYSRRYGVSPDLVKAIVSVESCYDRNAVSRVGAQGLMQLMPGTATDLGVIDSFDIEQNLQAGIQYFGMLNRQFNFNFHHALAAYNAGPNTVVKFSGIPPFPETEDYVLKVVRKYKEFINSQ